MDLGKYSEQLLSSKNAGALKQLSEGANGRRVAGMLDEEKLKRAVQTGDGDALQAALQTILSTPEGRALAAEVKKVVDSQ